MAYGVLAGFLGPFNDPNPCAPLDGLHMWVRLRSKMTFIEGKLGRNCTCYTGVVPDFPVGQLRPLLGSLTGLSLRFLGLVAGLTLGCAEPQAYVEPRAQPQPVQPPTPRERCPARVVGYEEPSSVGLSAAEFVARFGNRRAASRVDPALTSSSAGNDLPVEASVSFGSAGGTVNLVECPSDHATLVVPIRVTLELLGMPQLAFDASLSAMGPSHVYIRGNAQLFGAKTPVSIELDPEDVQITLLDRPDLPRWPRWSSLCNAQPNSFLGEFVAAIPGPLLEAGTTRTMTCSKGGETSDSTEPTSSWEQPPMFLLTRVDPNGCREVARGKVASFRGEVTAGPDQSWMPQAAPVAIYVDADSGVAKLSFRTELPPSDLVRSFHACPRAVAGARLAYSLELQRTASGVRPKSEVFDLYYKCEDVSVRCDYDSSRGP